jgi:hypothetical protein
MIDTVPTSLGGLPEGAPQRPATPPAFPAVHDMPPSRADTALSETERKRLEADLVASRERNAKAAVEETTGATATATPPAGTARNP